MCQVWLSQDYLFVFAKFLHNAVETTEERFSRSILANDGNSRHFFTLWKSRRIHSLNLRKDLDHCSQAPWGMIVNLKMESITRVCGSGFKTSDCYVVHWEEDALSASVTKSSQRTLKRVLHNPIKCEMRGAARCATFMYLFIHRRRFWVRFARVPRGMSVWACELPSPDRGRRYRVMMGCSKSVLKRNLRRRHRNQDSQYLLASWL